MEIDRQHDSAGCFCALEPQLSLQHAPGGSRGAGRNLALLILTREGKCDGFGFAGAVSGRSDLCLMDFIACT